MLRDSFIIGLEYTKIMDRLLEEDLDLDFLEELTLEKTVQIVVNKAASFHNFDLTLVKMEPPEREEENILRIEHADNRKEKGKHDARTQLHANLHQRETKMKERAQ